MKKSILTFTLFSIFIFMNAQIIHINLNDTNIKATSATPSIFDLDIDQDGTADFNLSMSSDLGTGGQGISGSASFVSGSFSSLNGMVKEASWGDAFLFSITDSIGANLNSIAAWSNFTSEVPVSIYLNGTNYGMQWGGGVTDGYLGFKFDISGNLHYGWIKMDVPDGTIELTIKDWAYNSTPNASILAGDTGIPPADTTLIKEYIINNDLALYPTLTTGIVEFKKDINEPIEISIHNCSGALVERLFIENSRILDISELKKGLYLARLKTSDKYHTQKLILH